MIETLGESCHEGPCPTFYRDDTTGQVIVQGYVTSLPGPVPHGEDVVAVPGDKWARLLADLPASMLLRALAVHCVPRWLRVRSHNRADALAPAR